MENLCFACRSLNCMSDLRYVDDRLYTPWRRAHSSKCVAPGRVTQPLASLGSSSATDGTQRTAGRHPTPANQWTLSGWCPTPSVGRSPSWAGTLPVPPWDPARSPCSCRCQCDRAFRRHREACTSESPVSTCGKHPAGRWGACPYPLRCRQI